MKIKPKQNQIWQISNYLIWEQLDKRAQNYIKKSLNRTFADQASRLTNPLLMSDDLFDFLTRTCVFYYINGGFYVDQLRFKQDFALAESIREELSREK